MRRWFRALMRLFPSDFRGDFGAEMQDVFGEELGAADGRRGRAGVFGRNAMAMARSGPRLHAQQTWQDVRYAFRALRHTPVFTSVAVSALAFGLGAAVITFGVADAFLFKPLPFADPGRLVHVWAAEPARGLETMRVSLQEFEAWAARSDVFDGAALFNYTSVELTGGPTPERVPAGRVSANVFDVLGVGALRGRLFAPGDDRPGAEPVALIAEEFWRAALASGPDSVGSTIEIGGIAHRIVGVLPAAVMFPLPTTRLWVPHTIDRDALTAGVQSFQVAARLRPGVSRAQAAAALDGLAPELQRAHPELAGRRANVVPLGEALNFAYDIFAIGTLVMGFASGLVLLTASANISSLMLGRAVRRGREVAIRSALGASRVRLVRQFLAESVVLSALGATAGLAVAAWGLRLLARVIPEDLHRAAPFAVDGRAMLVAAVLAASAAIIFGLAPALRFARVNLGQAMRQDGGAGTTSRSSLRLQSRIIEAQVALSVVLLVATVLVGRSFSALGAVDPGFEPDGVVTFSMQLPASRYDSPAAVARFHEDVVARVRAVPGVAATTTVNFLPLNHESRLVRVAVDGAAEDESTRPDATELAIGPDYFEVMRIPVLEGRPFAAADRGGGLPVAVVNRTMAERHWPGRSAIGATIRVEGRETPLTIVGVVGDTLQVDLAERVRSELYRPQAQQPWSYMRVLARIEGDEGTLVPSILTAIREVDPLLPLTDQRLLRHVVDEFLLPQRSLSLVLMLLGAFTLWLALFGIYGIVTCFVADRTRELGVRVALGADERRIVGYVLRRGLRLACIGAGAGMALAIGAGVLLRGLVSGVRLGDPVAYAAVVGLVVLVSGLAALAPARRAARVSPLTAMRSG
jgi:putative ABC transport system permease protein